MAFDGIMQNRCHETTIRIRSPWIPSNYLAHYSAQSEYEAYIQCNPNNYQLWEQASGACSVYPIAKRRSTTGEAAWAQEFRNSSRRACWIRRHAIDTIENRRKIKFLNSKKSIYKKLSHKKLSHKKLNQKKLSPKKSSEDVVKETINSRCSPDTSSTHSGW